MKLLTTIPPRTDGTVIARIPGSDVAYTFKGYPPVCDVAEKHVKYLLGTKQFMPAEAADYEKAGEVIEAPEEDPGYEIKTLEVGDGEDGSEPAPDAPAFDIATADNKALREFIKAKTGQVPGPATSLDKLRAIAETVAD